MLKLVIASDNAHKLEEIREILGANFDIISKKEAGVTLAVEETGSTFEENALIKARAVCEACGMVALADDSGLMVDALDGAPGVYSARYAGEGHNDAQNNAKLLAVLDGVADRRAHFVSAVALCYPSGKTITAEGRVDGVILDKAKGSNGFGYDPLFYCEEIGKTFAEAQAAEKNALSHRKRALAELIKKL